MARIKRALKFGVVGVTITGLGTLLAGCSQEDSIRAIFIFILMLLTGGGGEEATTTEQDQASSTSIAISVGNPTLTGLPSSLGLNSNTSILVFENAANETGEITQISFHLDSSSSLPADIQVFTATFSTAGGGTVTYNVIDVSSTITVTSSNCTTETICTITLPTPIAINKDDEIGWTRPAGASGILAVDMESMASGAFSLACTASCVPVKGNTIIFDFIAVNQLAFGGTGATP